MSALSLRGFGVAFGPHVVLASIDLDVPEAGVTSLVGDSGAGKSTLLRTLAGLNEAQPAFRSWGTAVYRGLPMGEERPALVQQNVRFLTATVRENLVSTLPNRSAVTQLEQTDAVLSSLARFSVGLSEADLGTEVVSLPLGLQRRLAIARAALMETALVALDEPTANLEDDAADGVLETIAEVARVRGVLLVTHNKRHAKQLGGRVALLAGGRIVERRGARSFFDRPASDPAKSFVATGRSGLPGPMARPEDLRDSVAPPPPLPADAVGPPSREVGPRDFYWLEPGRLGGLPRPGIVAELSRDLEALRRLGVTFLVTLEETGTVPSSALHESGLGSLHFPIDDMRAPSFEAAAELCEVVERLIDRGHVVAMHCRAGMGRTGTMLACQLVWSGMDALMALDRVRGINPRWVQSDEQIAFLARFGLHVRTARDLEHANQRKKR